MLLSEDDETEAKRLLKQLSYKIREGFQSHHGVRQEIPPNKLHETVCNSANNPDSLQLPAVSRSSFHFYRSLLVNKQ